MGVQLTGTVRFEWTGDRYRFVTADEESRFVAPGIPCSFNRMAPVSDDDRIYAPAMSEDGKLIVKKVPRKNIWGCSAADVMRDHLSNRALRELGEYIAGREPWVLHEPYIRAWAQQISDEATRGRNSDSHRRLWPLAAAVSLAYHGIVDAYKRVLPHDEITVPFLLNLQDSNIHFADKDALESFTVRELCERLMGVHTTPLANALGVFLKSHGESNLALLTLLRGMEPDHMCRAIRAVCTVNLYATNIPMEGIPKEVPLWWRGVPSATKARLLEKGFALCCHVMSLDIPGEEVSYRELGVKGSDPLEYHDAALKILLARSRVSGNEVKESVLLCADGPAVEYEGVTFTRIRRESELVQLGHQLGVCVGSSHYSGAVERGDAVMYCGRDRDGVPLSVYHFTEFGLVEARGAHNVAVDAEEAEAVVHMLGDFLKGVYPDGTPLHTPFNFKGNYGAAEEPVLLNMA